MQEQSFFHDALQINGQDWIRFDQNEYLKDTSKALVVGLKKKSRLFTIFPDFISIFQTFFQVWKIAGQISRLFQEFKTQ